jgi:type VI secretion system protein ImpL
MVLGFVFVIVLLLGLGAVWGLGWFFGLALGVKIALTVLLLAFLGLLLVLRHLKSVRAARHLERAIVAPGTKPAENAMPLGRRKEVLELQQRAQRAVAALKATRVGGGGSAALYALPWYVIVGPPGAGKTTAILHSGLDLPLEKAGLASRFRGTGGTRNCDWWFTNEGVFLDTAGRYAMESEDQEEWFAFLDVLRANRPRKPLNGLIVALSVTDLLGATDEQIALMATRLRARMDEVTKRLKTLVPVYVLLTKADLIAGFTEFWGDLRASERGAPWGMAFPLGDQTNAQAAVEQEFDLLVQRVHARLKRRFAAERHPNVRRTLSTFPLELVRVRASLGSLVGQLFKANAYQELPLLRGVYFTSGTQNAPPSSLVTATLAKALGVKPPAPSGAVVEAKSYFLTDVFRRVIFPDRSIAARTAAEARRQLLVRLVASGLALLTSAALILPASITWLRNRELVASTAEVSGAVESGGWSDATALEGLTTHLDDARARLTELAAWRDEGAPVQLRWGMYTGDALLAGLRAVYATAVNRAVVTSVRSELEDRLRAFDSGPVRSSENFNRDFDVLKLYLMLGSAEHVDPSWAAPRIVRLWSQRSRVRTKEELILPHVAYLLELEKRGDVAPWPIDTTLADHARSILAQVPQLDRMYESLVRDANTEIAPIRRETIFFGSVAPFVQSRSGTKVAGAYTAQGWLRVRSLLGQQHSKLAAEEWVLGGTSDGGADDTTRKLRNLYFERHRAAWRDFIADLQVQDPENAEIALEELNALSEPEWPYLRLVRTLAENTALDVEEPSDGLLAKVTDTAKEILDAGPSKRKASSPVEKAFKPIVRFGLPPDSAKETDSPPPTGLSQYEAVLQKVIAALTDLRDGETASDPRKVSDVFQDAFRSTTALLSEQDDFTRPLLAPLLMNPITLAWKRVVHDAGASAGANWESGVWQKWHDKLEGRYPFAPSTTDASVDDFLDFFAPADGALWSFYDESLKPTLDRRGSSFVPARRFKSAIGYTPDFLDVCMKRGKEITSVIFPPKADRAAVTFDVNLHSVSATIGEVTIEIEGVSHTYRNEPEQWITMVWPGKGAHGARLQVRGAGALNETIARPGDFGLFRLLDAAEVRPGRAGGRAEGSPTLVATWPLDAARDGATVSLDVRPSRADNPLTPGFFKDYTCPRAITAQ